MYRCSAFTSNTSCSRRVAPYRSADFLHFEAECLRPRRFSMDKGHPHNFPFSTPVCAVRIFICLHTYAKGKRKAWEVVIVCSFVEGTIGWRPAFVCYYLIPSYVQFPYCLALSIFPIFLADSSISFYKYPVLSSRLGFVFVHIHAFGLEK